jgi:hypothetical protein
LKSASTPFVEVRLLISSGTVPSVNRYNQSAKLSVSWNFPEFLSFLSAGSKEITPPENTTRMKN